MNIFTRLEISSSELITYSNVTGLLSLSIGTSQNISGSSPGNANISHSGEALCTTTELGKRASTCTPVAGVDVLLTSWTNTLYFLSTASGMGKDGGSKEVVCCVNGNGIGQYGVDIRELCRPHVRG